MREAQYVGLTAAGSAFLRENIEMIPDMVCPKCGEVISHKMNERIYSEEKYQDETFRDPDLHEYTLKDGRKVREVIQIQPWSSGPMSFICLEDENGKRMFEWKEDRQTYSEYDEITGTYYV